MAAARRRGEEYLLERRLFRRKSTGEVIDPSWLEFSFPHWYFYDVLRGLEYLRAAGVEPDERVAEAIDVVEGNGTPTADGRPAGHEGEMPFEIEPRGQPSRWNTLRAMRVLDWFCEEITPLTRRIARARLRDDAIDRGLALDPDAAHRS